RGQDPRLDAAGVPERDRGPGRPPGDRQRLSRPPRRGVDGGPAPVPPDAERRGPPHPSPGPTIGPVAPDDSTPDEKRAQYDCDITYGTNNEFGFDYLRDNMVVDIGEQTQRGHRNQSWSAHFFSIVDEVDSILIDEARTPLIISGRAADAAE